MGGGVGVVETAAKCCSSLGVESSATREQV